MEILYRIAGRLLIWAGYVIFCLGAIPMLLSFGLISLGETFVINGGEQDDKTRK